LANEDLIGRKQFCVVCTNELNAERMKFRSVTCSDECQSIRQRLLRKRVDDRECRFCHKPSTPARRDAFKRFKKWERTFPDQAFPDVWEIVSAAGVTLKELSRAVVQAERRDVMLDPAMSEFEWGSTKRRKDDDKPTPELDRVLEILADHQASTRAPEPKPEEAAA
jgi:hypothetical protein